MMRRGLATLTIALCACGEPLVPPGPPPAAPKEPPPNAAVSPADRLLRLEIDRMMARVTDKRALALKVAIDAHVMRRGDLLEKLRASAERDLPPHAIESDGELARAFGLVAPDFDYQGHFWELVTASVGGYYDQHDKTMFLLDDLPADFVETALAHELVHALQDQHFDLAALLAVRPGDSDRVAAAHVLCEGDATSSMYEVTLGDASLLDVETLRLGLGEGAVTPSAV